MTSADSFESHRPRLFAVAYRMLGSATEAEDVVQDGGAVDDERRDADARHLGAKVGLEVRQVAVDNRFEGSLARCFGFCLRASFPCRSTKGA